jgi:hypothetical protein
VDAAQSVTRFEIEHANAFHFSDFGEGYFWSRLASEFTCPLARTEWLIPDHREKAENVASDGPDLDSTLSMTTALVLNDRFATSAKVA